MVEIDGRDVTFLVSSSTPVSKLGSAIAHAVYAGKAVTLRAIGPGPVSQAQKALAVASGYTAQRGYDLATRASFTTVEMPDRDVTAMVFKVVTL